MVGAGLLARNAVARGLRVGPTVKTSLAPGSRAVTGYLEAAGLMAPLEALGFALAGYGCTTCIGNSGPLDEAVAARGRGERPGRRGGPVRQPQLRGPDPSAGAGELPRLAAAGRRLRPGRPGRHRPDDRAARDRRRRAAGLPRRHLAGARRDPRGHRRRRSIPELFRRTYATVFDGDDRWRALPIPSGDRYAWDGRLDLHRQAAVLRWPDARRRAGRRHRRRPGPRRPRRLGHDRPHLAGRLDRAARRPPASGSRRTASARSSSTRTARGAATTR